MVLADMTGYEVEMLEDDMNLESGLVMSQTLVTLVSCSAKSVLPLVNS